MEGGGGAVVTHVSIGEGWPELCVHACEIRVLNLLVDIFCSPHFSCVIENYHSLNTATAALLHSLYPVSCK